MPFSTDFSRLNGRPVHKHVFRPGDNLRIGNFELRYVIADDAKCLVAASHAVVQPITENRRAELQKVSLLFLQGAQKGQVKFLKKTLFTIGRPGESVAVITRRTHGTYLLHVGGEMPDVNGKKITNTGQLQNGDVIDVGEDKIKITLG